MSARAAIVEDLLDAAFNELQHDTGESSPEYVYQRAILKKRFLKILAPMRSPPSLGSSETVSEVHK